MYNSIGKIKLKQNIFNCPKNQTFWEILNNKELYDQKIYIQIEYLEACMSRTMININTVKYGISAQNL